MVKRVAEKFFIAVAPKRGNGDIEEAAKGGINMIINNRPDGESEDQMSSEEIARIAKTVGVDYVHIPVVPTEITDEQITQMQDALKQAGNGFILGTCRTGMRSMILYSLAQARNGVKCGDLMAIAKEIGFDLIDHRDRMLRLNTEYDKAKKAAAGS